MKKFLFSTLHVTRLTDKNLFGLVKSTIGLAIPAKVNLGDLSKATLNQLIIDFEKYEQVLKRQQKSELSDRLSLADKDRNERFTEIKRSINLHLKGRDAIKKAVAQSLECFFKPFWKVETKPMNTETALLSSLFVKYHANIELQKAAIKIGIDILLTELEGANIAYDIMYQQRLGENAELADESAKEQRNKVIDAYTEFCNSIEQVSNFTPNESILVLFNGMDELRMEYNAFCPKGKR